MHPPPLRRRDLVAHVSWIPEAKPSALRSRCIARKKPFLSAKAKAVASNGRTDSGDWRKVVFADECSISAGRSHGGGVTRKPGEEFLENRIAPKFSDYSAVMIWGAIRGGKKSEVWFGRFDWGKDMLRQHSLSCSGWSNLIMSEARYSSWRTGHQDTLHSSATASSSPSTKFPGRPLLLTSTHRDHVESNKGSR